MDYRQVRALVLKTSERGEHKEEERGRSKSPRSSEGVLEAITHCEANLLRIQSECWWMLWSVSDEASTRVRVLFGTTPHRGVSEQPGVEGHPKVRVRGSTRVRGECCASPA